MKITIEDIISAGIVPESFNNIKPGIAVFYAPEEGIDAEVKNLVIDLVEKCMKQRKGFALRLKVEATSNQMLEGCIVARRLNLGSLLQYNLLIGRMNCQESVDAFVKEFFNLTSRDDEALKFINKKKVRPVQSFDDDYSSFSSTNMLQMIVMRPRIERKMQKKTNQKAPLGRQRVMTNLYKKSWILPIERMRKWRWNFWREFRQESTQKAIADYCSQKS